MSYWAWYIVKEEGETRLFSDRWGARSNCCHWLFWGPDLLPHMLARLEPATENASPDWAEGGMTVDFTTRRLTWFCEEPVDDCLSILEALLSLQRVLWSGWEVRWATRGLDDLLNSAGLPPRENETCEVQPNGPFETQPGEPVIDDAEFSEENLDGLVAEPDDEPFGVASLLESDGRRKLLPLGDSGIEEILDYGPLPLLHALSSRLSHPSVTLPAAWRLPQSGFDIDPQERVLSFWSSDSVWTGDFPKEWEGWTIIDWGLDYGAHEKLLNDRLHVELHFTIETLEYLEEYLLPDSEKYEPADFPLDLAERKKRWKLALSSAFPEQPLSEL